MKATSYATSISTFSIAVVTVGLIAMTLLGTELERIHRIFEFNEGAVGAREAFVRKILYELPAHHLWTSCDGATTLKLTGDDVRSGLLRDESFCIHGPGNFGRIVRIEEVASSMIDPGARNGIGFVDRGWQPMVRILYRDTLGLSQEIRTPLPLHIYETEPVQSAPVLRKLAIAMDISKVPSASMDEDDFDQLSARLVEKLSNLSTKIPFVDIEIKTRYALHALCLITLGLFAVMRNQLRYLFLDPELGAGDPWLLVDAGVGVEKYIANTWLLLLVLVPWIVGASAIAAGTGHVWVEHAAPVLEDARWHFSMSDAPWNVVSCVVSIGITLVSSRLSLAVVAALLQLRYRRRELELAVARESTPIYDFAGP